MTAITERVIIDGAAVETQGLRAGPCWILEADLGRHQVTVAARNWATDDIHLDEITDLGPYVAGTRQLFTH